MQIVTRSYEGHAIAYQDDGWFNATTAAAKFGKAPHDWLRLPATVEYLASKYLQSDDSRRARAIARVEGLAAELASALVGLKGGTT